MWKEYIHASSIEDVLEALDNHGENARIIAGATDLILEIERGIRKGIEVIIDISRIPELDRIVLDENDIIHLGPLVIHNHCVASKLIRERAMPLSLAAWEVGSPQIRNRGTIVGNLVTASPANDAISPLMALDAELVIQSLNSERIVALKDFYTGVRKTVLQPNEMITDIRFPAMKSDQAGNFKKMALRKAQAISVINVSVVLSMQEKIIKNAAITLGAVAPTIIHASEAEAYLVGKELDDDTILQTSKLVEKAIRPINDIRGSAAYRRTITKTAAKRALTEIRDGVQMKIPEEPVLLSANGLPDVIEQKVHHQNGDMPIRTTINGKEYLFTSGYGKTLLRLIREDAGLIGTKEGCAEGECGACTVILDGQAVMSCMVPAERAHNAEIITIEGIIKENELHPVQKAFIDEGAVQCGYCTPGFIMSAVKLMEEKQTPSQLEIKQAIS